MCLQFAVEPKKDGKKAGIGGDDHANATKSLKNKAFAGSVPVEILHNYFVVSFCRDKNSRRLESAA